MTPRERVVKEALEWVGTPYIPHAQVKGAGVDCATILVGVYGNAGVIAPFNLIERVGRYPVEWNLHQEAERYLEGIFEWVELQTGPVQPGDIGLFKMGRTVAHSGIVVDLDPIRMVHAWRFQGTAEVEVTTWNPFWNEHFHGWYKVKGW